MNEQNSAKVWFDPFDVLAPGKTAAILDAVNAPNAEILGY
jgi:hypothetical protein